MLFLNDSIAELLKDEEKTYYSELTNTDNGEEIKHFNTEFYNYITLYGLPPHNLTLK